MNQKGFAPVLIVVLIATIIGGFLVYSGKVNLNKPQDKTTTVEQNNNYPAELQGYPIYPKAKFIKKEAKTPSDYSDCKIYNDPKIIPCNYNTVNYIFSVDEAYDSANAVNNNFNKWYSDNINLLGWKKGGGADGISVYRKDNEEFDLLYGGGKEPGKFEFTIRIQIKDGIQPTSDETANWKIYKSSNLGFEMKYPDFLYPGLEKQENVAFGFGEKGGVPIPYLTITKTEFLDYKNLPLKKCLKYQGLEIEYCIEKSSNWGQEKDLSDIKLDKKDAKSFYVSDFTCKYHIVQTTGSPFIELRMCVSRGVPDDIFNQILSTFKFLDQNKSSEGKSETIEKDGVTMTISPSSGNAGSLISIKLTGVPANSNLPFASVNFKDSTGAFGEEGLTTDYKVDTRKLGLNGSYKLTFKIPANVLVNEFPDAQNPNKKVPTSLGKGYIVFAYNDPVAYRNQQPSDKTIEVPFVVTK